MEPGRFHCSKLFVVLFRKVDDPLAVLSKLRSALIRMRSRQYIYIYICTYIYMDIIYSDAVASANSVSVTRVTNLCSYVCYLVGLGCECGFEARLTQHVTNIEGEAGRCRVFRRCRELC